MEINKKQIESILFVVNESITFKDLGLILSLDREQVKDLCVQLKSDYKDRGISLILSDTDVHMTTSGISNELLEKITEREMTIPLSDAAKETLSIVLYAGPATPETIDSVRGVRSSRSLKNLERRGYVKNEKGFMSITTEGLRQLGLDASNSAPDYEKTRESLYLLSKENNQ